MCRSCDPDDSEDSANEVDPEDSIMVVTDQTQNHLLTPQARKRKTMRFQGFVGKQQIIVLLDSSSASTFISDALTSQLGCVQQPCKLIQFATIDGIVMSSEHQVSQFQWNI